MLFEGAARLLSNQEELCVWGKMYVYKKGQKHKKNQEKPTKYKCIGGGEGRVRW